MMTACLLTLSLSSQATEKSSIWFTAGQQNNAPSYSIGFKQYSVGIEFGYIADTEYGGYRFDYPTYNSYQIIGERSVSYPTGTDLLFFHRIGAIEAYFGIGFYNQHQALLAQETSSGYVYTQYTKNKVMISGSSGIKVDVMKNLSLLAGYHTIRGANIGLSFNY